jgi:hypothetical protein
LKYLTQILVPSSKALSFSRTCASVSGSDIAGYRFMSRIMTFISDDPNALCNPTSFLTVKLVLSYKSLPHEMSRTMVEVPGCGSFRNEAKNDG